MLKKCVVKMLPTNQKAIKGSIYLTTSNTLAISDNGTQKLTNDIRHLYLISAGNPDGQDDKIEEGDYIYHPLDGKVVLCDKEHYETLQGCSDDTKYGYKKIIATTDTNLKIGDWIHNDTLVTLPKPSLSFISKYIEYYNKGSIITDVMVEYMKDVTIVDELQWENNNLILKVNKDNTITIKRVKDSWNRDEVAKAIHDCMIYANSIEIGSLSKYIDKWINDNL